MSYNSIIQIGIQSQTPVELMHQIYLVNYLFFILFSWFV